MKKNRPIKSFAKSLMAPMTRSSKERKKEKKYLRRLNSLDDQAKETAIRCREYTLLNPEKLHAFIQAIRYIEKNGIAGDIVECGVWRGGAIRAAALTLKQLNASERTFYLYDTFAGMSRPTDKDRPMPGTGDIDVKDEFERAKTGHNSSEWCYASLEGVKNNLSGIDYDQSKFVYVKGGK